MSGLAEFLLARIADDEAATFELVPYRCEPGCCAPAGWVGHRCLICGTEDFGGTVEAITTIAREHDEQIHRRSRVLAECDSKRRLIHACTHEVENWVAVRSGVHQNMPVREPWGDDDLYEDALRYLALPYRDHPDYRQEWSL